MRRALAATGAATLVLLPTAPAVAEEGVPETGWWSRSRVGAPSPLEAPLPFVPPGGTWVSGNANGVVALSALRLELPEDATASEIRLEVADVRGTPAVQACAAAARWSPNADGRRFDEAPAADCGAFSATGAVAEGRLVVPLAGVPAGTVDVVLLPAAGTAFSLTMRPASAASVTVAAPGEPAPPPAPADAAPSAPAAGGSGSAEPPPLSSSSGTLPAFEPGSGAVSAPLLPGALPPAAASPDVAAPQAAGSVRGALPTRPSAAVPVDDGRSALVAALALAALGALAVRLAGTPVAAPAALGGAARLRRGQQPPPVATTPVVRGVGRFRTERSGRPTPL